MSIPQTVKDLLKSMGWELVWINPLTGNTLRVADIDKCETPIDAARLLSPEKMKNGSSPKPATEALRLVVQRHN